MYKIDSNTIIKNLTGILCGTIIISLLFPFVSIGASANAGGMGEAEESTVLNGFQIITDGGFLGILLIVCPIAILIANYLPQLQKYKKIVSLALSVVGIVMMFLVSGNISAGANAGGEAVGQMTGGSVSVEMKTNYLLGFWLMLIFFIGIVILSAIQFFNLKGNKVFDAVNNGTSDENAPEINLQKIANIAKSKTNSSTENAKSSSNDSQRNTSIINESSTPQSNINYISMNATDSNSYTSSVSQSNLPINQTNAEKENPEKIMELIKKLFDMKESGILTDEEFNIKKQELLNKM